MKLHVKELRIGNYVNYKDEDHLFEVVGIDELGIRVKDSEQETWIEYDCFEPIPLTEEWLLRFKEIQRIDEGLFSIYGERYIELTFKGDGYNVDLGGIVICFVDTVHALQNAVFVILGTELTLIK